MHRRRVLVIASSALAVVLVAVAVPMGWSAATEHRGETAAPTDGSAPIDAAALGGSGPGSLISATTMPGLSRSVVGRNLQAARVVYRSTEGDTGAPTVVSGSVFVPRGPAPSGGWPVVAFGHGTLGIDKPCGASLSDTLVGQVSQVDGWIKQGYAVAFADYQGLGSDGIHPYPDSRTAGINIIDSVRALRKTFPDVSTRWAAFGGSQGGGATWAADEQAATYAPELNLVGAVAISPASDVAGLVDKAQAGTLTADQLLVYQLIVESLARLHQDVDRDDYRRGGAAQYWDILSACSGPMVNDRLAAAATLRPRDFTSTPEAADRVRGYLLGWALPQQKLSAPLFVAYGGADTFIDAAWIADSITRACRLGGTVQWDFDPNRVHSDANFAALQAWMADRLSGKPVTNECA